MLGIDESIELMEYEDEIKKKSAPADETSCNKSQTAAVPKPKHIPGQNIVHDDRDFRNDELYIISQPPVQELNADEHCEALKSAFKQYGFLQASHVFKIERTNNASQILLTELDEKDESQWLANIQKHLSSLTNVLDTSANGAMLVEHVIQSSSEVQNRSRVHTGTSEMYKTKRPKMFSNFFEADSESDEEEIEIDEDELQTALDTELVMDSQMLAMAEEAEEIWSYDQEELKYLSELQSSSSDSDTDFSDDDIENVDPCTMSQF
jgi:hypothetical protein